MPDYNEATVSGKEWQRACRVVIENPYGGVPSINFIEETAVLVNEKFIATPCSNIVEQFDPAKEIELRDANNGLTGEKVSYGMLYVILNSLYRQLAEQRDGAA
mgnify:CR=1 FL=1